MRLDVDDMCFACGQNNPVGLKLRFRFEGDEYATTFHVRPEHQGWAGIAHGGLVATVLDELMARLLWEKHINAITGRLEVRFRRPVVIGETLEVRGRIVRHSARGVETTAEARGEDGQTVAEARAISVKV